MLIENSALDLKSLPSSRAIQNHEMAQLIPTGASNMIYYCETVPESEEIGDIPVRPPHYVLFYSFHLGHDPQTAWHIDNKHDG